ncbi:MAG: pseudouridine synthase [Eubacteriales bacterium]|nr:pseudouridine synthase [Eubacteriales bacterium]
MAQIRIDKFLANAGLGTRSEIKNHIKKGFVYLNDIRVTKSDTHIDPAIDIVRLGDQVIQMDTLVYYILNKPAGYVSATKDNTAPTVLSLINSKRNDLFPVGRLDKDTEGLLLITNDGALSHRLLSPRHHVDKTYFAIVEGEVTQEDIRLFSEGLHIGDDDFTDALPAQLTIDKPYNKNENVSYVQITIQEGKFHQIKRMFQAVNKKVIYLKRISFGDLVLPDDLELGHYRELTKQELLILQQH